MVLNSLGLATEDVGGRTNLEKKDKEVPIGFSICSSKRYVLVKEEERSLSDTQSR